MQSEESLSLKQTAGGTLPNVVIKQETEWLAEDSHTPDLAHQEFDLDMQYIKTEEDLSSTDAGAHENHQFPLDAGTLNNGYGSRNQEILGGKIDSDFLTPAYSQCLLTGTDDQRVRVSTSAKKSETCEPSLNNIYPNESKKRMHKCEFCSRSFSKSSSFEKHLLTHAQDKTPEFACPSCQSSYHSKCELARHFRIHNPDTNNCRVCGARFTLKKNLKRHMLRKHSGGTQKLSPCPRTSNDLVSDEELLEDDAASDALESRRRACGQQSGQPSTAESRSKFDEFSTYNSYSKELLETCECPSCSKRTHRCELCFRSYSKKSNLNKHLKTHAAERKREYACHSCGKAFYTKCDLMSHMTVHTGGTFNCQVCGTRFTHIRNLKEHMVRQHPAETQTFVPDLQTPDDSTVNTKSEFILEEEFLPEEKDEDAAKGSLQSADEASVSRSAQESESCETSHNIQPRESVEYCKRNFRCELCVRPFKTQTYLKRHMKTHVKKRKREFACHLCGTAFYTKRRLANHVDRLHRGENSNGGDCDASFVENEILNEQPADTQPFPPGPQTPNDASVQPKAELLSEDEFLDEKSGLDSASNQAALNCAQRIYFVLSEQDSVGCLICHKIYSKELIKTHMRLEHPERSYKCETCLRSFKNVGDFNRHKKTHAKNEKRKFACRSCEAAFYTKAVLKRHTRIHTGDTYNCQECGKRFTQSQSLTTHMLRKHKESLPPSERTFKCELCAGLFRTKMQLERHRSIHDDNRPRPYACEQCGSTFYVKTVLRKHLLTHDKKRKREFKCSFCEKTFYSRSVLNQHMKIHTAEAVRCELCGIRYTQARSLKKHMLRAHSGNLVHPVQESQTAQHISITSAVEEIISEENVAKSVSHDRGDQQKVPEIVENEPAKGNTAAQNGASLDMLPQHPPQELIKVQTHVENGELKYKCDMCPRFFKCEPRLRMHMSDHAEDRKRVFPCQSCGSAFYTKRGLLQHVMIHNRDKETHNCQVCGKRFRQSGFLKNHMQLKHSGEMNRVTAAPKTATDTSLHTKKEILSDEEFLDGAEEC